MQEAGVPNVGLVWMPRTPEGTVEIAQEADRLGFWGLGICDSPVVYHEMYPLISACLERTDRIRVGSNVTNPVTRHWTVHGAALRTYEQLYPGRFYLGIGSGDGAVHGVGLRPASVSELDEAVARIIEAAPTGADVQVATGGPRTAARLGATTSALILGTGVDHVALRTLGGMASTVGDPTDVWGLAPIHVLADGEDVQSVRHNMRAIVIPYARHAFDATFENKNVPEEFHEPMRERFARYRFHLHASLERESNAGLFDDREDIAEYLVDRIALIGRPDEVREQVRDLCTDAGLAGVHLVLVHDPVEQVRRVAASLEDFLDVAVV